MEAIALRVAARYAKRELNLSHYGLEGMTEGKPVKLYHGTTALFRSFDMARSRGELVDSYYGKGIFLTPDIRVAWDYADAKRNIGFPESIIGELKRKNKGAGELLQALYDKGQDGWETWSQEAGVIQEDGRWDHAVLDRKLKGVDGNTLLDIAEYIIGSKAKLRGGGDGPEELMAIFHGQSTGAPGHIYDSLDEVGLDSKKYRPKVYTVTVTVSNPLITASKSQARRARTKGYDCVIFHGSDLVRGVPEVAVFDSGDARIKGFDVGD